jgi:hypothetical protein
MARRQRRIRNKNLNLNLNTLHKHSWYDAEYTTWVRRRMRRWKFIWALPEIIIEGQSGMMYVVRLKPTCRYEYFSVLQPNHSAIGDVSNRYNRYVWDVCNCLHWDLTQFGRCKLCSRSQHPNDEVACNPQHRFAAPSSSQWEETEESRCYNRSTCNE